MFSNAWGKKKNRMSCSGCPERNADSISVHLHQSVEMTPENVLRINCSSFTFWVNHTSSRCHVTVGYDLDQWIPSSWAQFILQAAHSLTTRQIKDRRMDLLPAFTNRDLRHRGR